MGYFDDEFMDEEQSYDGDLVDDFSDTDSVDDDVMVLVTFD